MHPAEGDLVMGESRDRTFRRLTALTFAAAAAVAMAVVAPAVAEGTVLGAGSADAIPGSYLVVFKDGIQGSGVPAAATGTATKYGAHVNNTYSAALHGFAGSMSAQQARR